VSLRLLAAPASRACSTRARLPEYWVNTSSPASRDRPCCSKARSSTWLPAERLASALTRAPRSASVKATPSIRATSTRIIAPCRRKNFHARLRYQLILGRMGIPS